MPIEDVKCPDCNGEMISRKSQYGTFWGCKAYPKCKGTRDSNGMSRAEREAAKAENEKSFDDTGNDMPSNLQKENDRYRFRKS